LCVDGGERREKRVIGGGVEDTCLFLFLILVILNFNVNNFEDEVVGCVFEEKEKKKKNRNQCSRHDCAGPNAIHRVSFSFLVLFFFS